MTALGRKIIREMCGGRYKLELDLSGYVEDVIDSLRHAEAQAALEGYFSIAVVQDYGESSLEYYLQGGQV